MCSSSDKIIVKCGSSEFRDVMSIRGENEILHTVSKINNELISKSKIKVERIDDVTPDPAECDGDKVIKYDDGEGSTDIHIKNIKLEEGGLENFNSTYKSNEEISTKVKIKDEQMDDNSQITVECASNTMKTIFGSGGFKINFEDSKTDIGDIKFAGNIDVNWKESEPANLNTASTTIKEMPLKFEIKDEPMDRSLILTDFISDSVNDFAKGDDEISCDNTKIGFDSASACLRSSDLEEDFEKEGNIGPSVKRAKHRQGDKMKSPQININETCSPRRESDTNSCIIKTHKRAHANEKSYKRNVSILNTHKLIHTSEKPYKSDAGKFADTGMKLFKCDVCKKNFAMLNNLKTHKLTHTDEKPYKCDVCKKGFDMLNNLKTHKLTHTGEKPDKCRVCINAFTTSTYLKLRKMIDTDVETYGCNVCNKRFTNVSDLNAHKLVHTEIENVILHSVSKISNELTSKPKIKTERMDDDSPNSVECAGDKVTLSYDGGEGSTDIHIKNVKLEEEGFANFNSKTNEEVSTTVKIKDEPMDDNSLIPAECASNTIETVFVGGGCELKFEDSKTDIGDIKCVDDIDVNGKESEPANLSSTNTTVKEMSLKCEIKDEPMDSSLIPTDCINDFSKGDDEMGCEDTKISFDGASACLRSSDLEEDFENFEEESISASVKREKHKQGDKMMPHQLNINETCFPRKESDTNSRILKTHKREDSNEESYESNVSNKSFPKISILNSRELVHTGEKPYKCDVCEKCFSHLGNLKAHKATHTGEKPYICNVCKKCFSREGNLKIHKITHTGEKPYKCNVCEKCFSHLSNLKIHKVTHTCEKPYKCDGCKKNFALLANLKAHKRTHSGEKPYKCDVCKNCYSTLKYLKIHRKIHTGEVPYECNVCNRRFTVLSNLNTHKLVHTGEKPYKCDVCEKCFTHLGNLNAHKVTHTGEKPYKCDVCKKCFSHLSNLKAHKVTHTQEKPYKCDVCEKSFSYSGNLKTHKLTHTDVKLDKYDAKSVLFH